MLWLHAAFLGLVVGSEAVLTGVAAVDLRYARRAVRARAAWIEATLGIDDPDRLVAYQRDRTVLGHARTWTFLGVVLAVLYLGWFAELVRLVEGVGLGPVPSVALFVLVLASVGWALGLPWSWAGTFVVEERHGFNRQTPRGWFADQVKGWVLSLGFGVVLVGGLVGLVGVLPGTWWVPATVLYLAFVLAMQVVYPRVIAPWFHDFEPVEDPELRQAVEAVLARAGVAFDRIEVMDASRRTGHANAYFVGFGPEKRIVLFDTLVDALDLEALQGVLAHELAHWRRGHVWKKLAVSTAGAGLTLAALAWLVAWPPLVRMFAVPWTPYAALALAGLWVGPVRRMLAPLSLSLSRRFEREADDVAVELMGSGAPLADGLRRLSGENLSNPFPHPLKVVFHGTHPPMGERIRRLEADDAGPG